MEIDGAGLRFDKTVSRQVVQGGKVDCDVMRSSRSLAVHWPRDGHRRRYGNSVISRTLNKASSQKETTERTDV